MDQNGFEEGSSSRVIGIYVCGAGRYTLVHVKQI
jgi:hypothetical protein